MPICVEFSTITRMFDSLTEKFAGTHRPMLMQKVQGAYRGISYDEMRDQVRRCAFGFAAIGVRRGDRVALISENRPEWVIADMALMKLGAVNVSIYPTLTSRQMEFIFRDSGARFAVISNQLQLNKIVGLTSVSPGFEKIVIFNESAGELNRNLLTLKKLLELGDEFERGAPSFLAQENNLTRPDDLITLIYTSGTTGNPKGVMLSHGNLVSNIIASAECIPFIDGDVVLSFLPLCHSYERMAGYYTAMACGATIAYAESIEKVSENLVEVRPTIVTTVPRLFERIHNRIMKQINAGTSFRRKLFSWAIRSGKEYARRRRTGTVAPWVVLKRSIADALVFRKIRARTGNRIRFFVSGGAALSKDLGEFFDAVGISILEGYGMTESSPVISVNRPDDYTFGTVGKPIPGVEVRIAEDGEILVRGPNVMRGYWNNPEATAEVIDRDGWLHTGDIGCLAADGRLTITDRKKHLFVSSGGKNIAPQPIERLFTQNRYIDQFILIGDGKMYLTALVVPDFEAIRDFAEHNSLAYRDMEELVQTREINQLFDREISAIQKDLANFERVRKFTLLGAPLTLENGEVTPTLKIRREIVEDRFKSLIDRMYEGFHASAS